MIKKTFVVGLMKLEKSGFLLESIILFIASSTS